jgi:class 3 adenylate cyclase/tetratricopeptide (TPR) repeat protein
MMCARCQHDNPLGAKFCNACGAPLTGVCPRCGSTNPATNRFCNECGLRLAGAEMEASVAPELVSRPYTPSDLARHVLHSRAALEGERKQVTVLFADIKGSLELLGDLDPEEARRLLDPALERMMAAVHRYEGTVNQVLGDGIMALFGAPVSYEDHALRACYAALSMQEAIQRYAEEVHRAQGLEVQIRVGLNSGEVVVRSIGNDVHMDYSAIGQTTHLAARMEQLAAPGSICLTRETYRLVEGFVRVKSLGPQAVRGLAEPVEVFALEGSSPVRRRLQAAAGLGLTRFVGRDFEMEQIALARARACHGHGQVVAVIGEPGVGKSRLFYELSRSAYYEGCLVLETSAVSYGKSTPYLPVIDLLRDYFRIHVRDAPEEIRAKVLDKVGALDVALLPICPALLALLDQPVDDPHWQNLDPLQHREHTLDAVKRLLLRQSQVQPTILIVENLHWVDAESQSLLDVLVESVPTARLLLLVNYRPEYQHGWGGKTYYMQLRLDPLAQPGAHEFLQALLGHDDHLAELKQLLIDRTEGNPFFLEESVRTLIETGVVVGQPGAYRLRQALPTIRVPATVQAVLAARIDRLSAEEKRLLQTAAVVGTSVALPLLQAIADLPESTLRAGLRHLQAAEFLYETQLFPEPEYTFKHALTHEVAYGSLLQGQRRALHAKIVEAIERLSGDRQGEQLERLAHHALRGKVWDKALKYAHEVGTKALQRSANRQAIAAFDQALSALQHLPQERDMIERGIDLRLDLRNACMPLGDSERIFTTLRQAEELAQAMGDTRRLGRVALYLTEYFRVMGEPDRALASGQQALDAAASLGDFGMQVVANFYVGSIHHTLGDYALAIDHFQRTVAALQGDLGRQRFGMTGLPAVLARTRLAWCFAELGAFAEGLAVGADGIGLAEAVDQPFSMVNAYTATSFVYLRRGDLDEAIAVLERGLALCQRWNIQLWLPTVASALGYAYTLAGRLTQAMPLLEQAVAMGRKSGGQVLWIVRLSEAHLLAGNPEAALPLAQEALKLAHQYRERGHQAYALRLLGQLYASQEPPPCELAAHAYQQALKVAEAGGMRPLMALCHLGLGTLHLRAGRPQPARAELTAAAEQLRELGMRLWLPQAEAALSRAE